LVGTPEEIFTARLFRFSQLSRIGRWADAQQIWDGLDPMGRDWQRSIYRPGTAEYQYAVFHYRRGDLAEGQLVRAADVAIQGKNRGVIRDLHRLRGEWYLQQSEWEKASQSLREAVSMARAVGIADRVADVELALSQFHLGQLADPLRQAQLLTEGQPVPTIALAELWLAIGDLDLAKKHAVAAYKWASGDGEPYVFRYELERSRVVLQQLDVEPPCLPAYEAGKNEKYPCEDEVASIIERIRGQER